jgi:Zn-finger nucleic acid-binding protein
MTSPAVPACPVCATPLEQNLDVFFCPSCRASLQTPDTLSATLTVPEVSVTQDRFAAPRGACPTCAGGTLRAARLLGETPAACDACGAVWLTGEQLTRMRARVARDRALAAPPPDFATYKERLEEDRRIAIDDDASMRYALPLALAGGVFAHWLGLSFLVWGTVEMWFHELGHAVVAWLSGFVAVPLPFFTMMPRETRSGWVVAIVLGMIGAIAYESARRGLWGLVAFAGGLAFMQLLLTFVLNPAQARQWGIFAGQGGAIVLPTLVMLAFYEPLGWRWDFWRYPVALIAAVGFVHALFLWTGVTLGTGVMPHGSAVGDDAHGDMERLVREYHWTNASLARSYTAIACACLVVLVATYVVHLGRAVAKESRARRG